MPGPARLGRNVIALSVVSFLTDVSSEMIYPLLPLFLSGTLGASAAMIGAIEGAAESAASVLKLVSGWWSDRARRRKPFVLAGYALASLARPLIAVAQSAGQVMAIRVSDRIGKGLRTAPRDALIAESVDPAIRGRAYGIHRAADHAGAVVGPLIAFAVLTWWHPPLRTVFWYAAVPAALSVLVVIFFVREAVAPGSAAVPAAATATGPRLGDGALPRRFWTYLAIVLLFTLGNSSDAFLLLRANQLGVPLALTPVLWASLHVVKSGSSAVFGGLSDRVGRRPLIVAGWLLFAVVYAGFAFAGVAWHAWALFVVYGLFFGLTEGVEKALVADLVPAARSGTAFGWYNLAIGLGALPASLVFGVIWDRAGAPAAFAFGASLAVLSAMALAVVRLGRYVPSIDR